MVIVRGMKMPENCSQCPLQSNGFCWAMPADTYNEKHTRRVRGKKPDWCPLVDGNGVAVIGDRTYIAKAPRVKGFNRSGECEIGGFEEDGE